MRIYLDTTVGTNTFIEVPVDPYVSVEPPFDTITTKTVWDNIRPLNPHDGPAHLVGNGQALVIHRTATDAPAGTVDLGDPEQSLGTGPNGMARVLELAQSRKVADAAGVPRQDTVGFTREQAVRLLRTNFWASAKGFECWWDDDDEGHVRYGPKGHRLAHRYSTLSPVRKAIVDGLTPRRRHKVLSITPRLARLARIDTIGGL